MPVPTGVRTVHYPWSWLLLPGLTGANPLPNQAFNNSVAEEKAEHAGKEKEPPENCFEHFAYLNLEQSRELVFSLIITGNLPSCT